MSKEKSFSGCICLCTMSWHEVGKEVASVFGLTTCSGTRASEPCKADVVIGDDDARKDSYWIKAGCEDEAMKDIEHHISLCAFGDPQRLVALRHNIPTLAGVGDVRCRHSGECGTTEGSCWSKLAAFVLAHVANAESLLAFHTWRQEEGRRSLQTLAPSGRSERARFAARTSAGKQQGSAASKGS